VKRQEHNGFLLCLRRFFLVEVDYLSWPILTRWWPVAWRWRTATAHSHHGGRRTATWKASSSSSSSSTVKPSTSSKSPTSSSTSLKVASKISTPSETAASSFRSFANDRSCLPYRLSHSFGWSSTVFAPVFDAVFISTKFRDC